MIFKINAFIRENSQKPINLYSDFQLDTLIPPKRRRKKLYFQFTEKWSMGRGGSCSS